MITSILSVGTNTVLSGNPPDALSYYNFKYSTAIELLKRQVAILSEHDTDVNVIQVDGLIATYTMGSTPLVRGHSALIEGLEATNIIVDSLTLQAASWTKRGTATAITSTTVAPDSNYFMDLVTVEKAITGGDIFNVVSSLTPGDSYSFAFWIANPTGSTETLIINNAAGGPGGINIDLSTIGVDPERITNTTPFIVSGGGSLGVQISSGFEAVEPVIQFEFWQADLTLSDFVSSPIYTTGVAATRDANVSTVSTFTELGVYLDKPGQTGSIISTTSDYNSGAWVNGVNSGVNQLTFEVGDTILDAKYQTFVTGDWVGVIGRVSTGGIVKVTGFTNFNRIVVTPIAGAIEEFRFPAEITWDFSTSDFYPNETGVGSVTELRTNTGDDLSGFPAAVRWPVNDFIMEGNYIHLDSDPIKTNSVPLDIYNSQSDLFRIFNVVSNKKLLSARASKGGTHVFYTAVLPSDIEYGDEILWSFEQSTLNGGLLTVTNVTKGESDTSSQPTDTGDFLAFAPTAHLCYSPTGGTLGTMNIELIKLWIK